MRKANDQKLWQRIQGSNNDDYAAPHNNNRNNEAFSGWRALVLLCCVPLSQSEDSVCYYIHRLDSICSNFHYTVQLDILHRMQESLFCVFCKYNWVVVQLVDRYPCTEIYSLKGTVPTSAGQTFKHSFPFPASLIWQILFQLQSSD